MSKRKQEVARLFSVTLGDEVIQIASDYMNSPEMIDTKEDGSSECDIEQFYINTSLMEKPDLLSKVLLQYQPESCIIFANTQSEIDSLEQYLRKKSYPMKKLHGELQQKERLRVMEQFKRKQYRYLLASDVAARGIDIAQVAMVIDYDMAKGPANYTHRIGRTDRNGAKGTAISFVLDEITDRATFVEILNKKGTIVLRELPKKTIKGRNRKVNRAK